jgi:hypothetical protein
MFFFMSGKPRAGTRDAAAGRWRAHAGTLVRRDDRILEAPDDAFAHDIITVRPGTWATH